MRRVCLWVVLGLALLLGLLSACEPEAAENNSRPEQGELALPLEGDIEADHLILENMRKNLGFDPLDIEAVLGYQAPKP